MHQNESLVCGD